MSDSLLWSPPVARSPQEDKILARCKKDKLFIFLRAVRHQLFDDSFQQKLFAAFPEHLRGKDPTPPALLAMALVLQAAHHLSDEDAAEAAHFDLRWRMLLGALDHQEPPFSQATLFRFRLRLIAYDLDRVLLNRAVEFAKESGLYSEKALRLALDSAPFSGAGRVEDTFNLLGHAARLIVTQAAKQLGLSFEEAALRAGIPLVTKSSIKAALDINWNEATQQQQALQTLLSQLSSLVCFVEPLLQKETSSVSVAEPESKPSVEEIQKSPMAKALEMIQRVRQQDVEETDGALPKLKDGVAKDRLISISDPEMRHGRKSKSVRVDGYKRHVGLDLDSGLIVAVEITAANRPESEALGPVLQEVKSQERTVAELDIDRGYIAAKEVKELREGGVLVICKPLTVRNHGRFTKAEFALDLEKEKITCPAGQSVPITLGQVSRFPKRACQSCSLREKCTKGKQGRSVQIHEEEPFQIELKRRQETKEGREELRERVSVEHALACVCQSQGKRARYTGVRKNLYDLRRHAMLANLFITARHLSAIAVVK